MLMKLFFLVLALNMCASSLNYENIPVLVTGGCGFIGSELVKKLVALKASVTILDNLSTGTIKNIESVIDQVTFLQGDITNLQICLEAAHGKQIIFHLAAAISVPESANNPTKYYHENILGTLNILEAARINNVQRLVLSSSAAVYGNKDGICNEEDDCCPMSVYGFTKLMNEYCFEWYAKQYGLKTICLRYFNVHGKNQNPSTQYAAAASKFRYQLEHGLPITIFGDGLQKRDYVSVEDVVRANIMLAQLPSEYMCGQRCNVATGKSINLFELLDLLKKETGKTEAAIHFFPARAGDVRISQANCQRLQEYMALLHDKKSIPEDTLLQN